MKDNEQPTEPKDSVTLLREYAAIRVFHADTFARVRTLMRNCADATETHRAALRAALEYVKAHTPPSSSAGTDIDMQRLIENALNGNPQL